PPAAKRLGELLQGPFADYSVVHPDYAAAGLLVYEFIKELGVTITKDIAKCLYTAIATDTGRFKYNSTTSEVLRAVAELYEYDINATEICTAVFDSRPLVQLKAEALALDNLELMCNGKVAVSYISKAQMDKIGALYEHVDTCIDRIRMVEGVEISIFVKEKEVGLNKLSLRAKSYANVARLAGELGGGGHERASGATLKCSLEDAINQAKTAAEREIARF
ncbi:MAG: DHHA1 domain-containing protein, partial [Clostridia bacterium]|nr:DHHA1 domain-containing protein [Clostridia bacterium]